MSVEKQKKLKFNIFDIVVILALIVVVLSYFFKDSFIDTIVKEKINIRYSFVVEEMTPDAAANIVKDSEIKECESRFYMGKIVSVLTEPKAETVILADGTPYSYDSGLVKATATAECVGYQEGECLFLSDGLFITAGSEFDIETETSVFHIIIINATK